ncbi:peptidoglycan-binding domain-containing protein [Pseudomonas sp. NPDC089534]|uniref:peptidoglycan-binding domain-containing protein n=1 Tax=Pseudomonas sp. NPDC089534 TaxID=3364468 RepID=UPI00382973B4
MTNNPAFIIALALGALMLASVCYVYVSRQTFGLGGACLSGFGVVLVGMSVWTTIDVAFDAKGVRAKLEQVETVAKRAESTASQAQEEARTTSQTVGQLGQTLEFSMLQDRLKAAGVYDGATDGHFGPATKAALERLQQQKGLPVTGDLDEATRRVLNLPKWSSATSQ